MSSSFKVIFTNDLTARINSKNNFNVRSVPFSASNVFLVPIESYELLTKGKDVKIVYNLKFTSEDIAHKFLPGDTIGILPNNDCVEVNDLLDRLSIKLYAEKSYRIDILVNTDKKKSFPKHIPTQGCVVDLFTQYIDIRTPPKKLFLKDLIKFTKDINEIQQLEEISAAKSTQKYIDLITGPGRTLLGLLKTFPSCFPPLEVILQHSQPLQPRVFSISSSPLSKNLSITFFIVTNPDGTKGVCTGYLEKCIEQSRDVRIPIYFRKPTNFRIPNKLSQHSILIAAGTGLAPFIGFLQHRLQLKMSQNCDLGDVIFYYGCRYSDRDFLFKNEVEHYLKLGIINKMYTAFSREKENYYVQDKIDENGMELVDYLMTRDAVVYICGQAKTMLKDVKVTIASSLDIHSNSEESGKDLVNAFINNKKIIMDIWNM